MSIRKVNILCIAVGVLTAMPGILKLAGAKSMTDEFQLFGLPHWMLMYIGCAELAVGVALLIKPLQFYATFANALLLTFALTATISSGMYLFAIVPALLFILSLAILMYYIKNQPIKSA